MYENYRVLFVDDEPNILNSLRRGLADEEFYCHFANSGKEALEIMEQYNIAVIVTDMRMPEMSGLELLNKVHELYPMTVKAILSGYTQLAQILVTINQVTIFKFITKPWELGDFISVVRTCLDYYMVQEQNVHYKKALEAKNTSYQNILKKINELVDDAKFSKELLAICGKALVRFGEDFTAGEKIAFQHTLTCRDALFDLMVSKITTQTKEIDANKLAVYFSDYMKTICPDCTVEKESVAPARIIANMKMMETAIDALWIIFAKEFGSSGIYCKIKAQEPFSLVIVAIHAETNPIKGSQAVRTELDARLELARAVLGKVLELSNIDFQIIKAEGSVIAEILIKERKEENGEEDTDR